MKKKTNVNKISFLMICIIMLSISCNKNIKITDKEQLLKERLQEYNTIMSEGKARKLYNLICPQMQTNMKNDLKEYLLSFEEDQIVEDFKIQYKTESINIDDDVGTVISYRKSGAYSPRKIYQYWGLTNSNWCLIELNRTEPLSQDVIDEYKKLIHNDQK